VTEPGPSPHPPGPSPRPPGPSPHPPGPTYYDRPAIKEPVWIWSVPAYFHAGGVTAGAALLAAATQHRADLAGFTTRCRWLAAGGAALSTAFLVHDLGRPARFLNMLRVFRPTSAMSMGSWTLAAGVGAPVLGTYTGVLLADTAVPVWQHTRHTLPPLFATSALASTTAALELLGLDGQAERITHRLGTGAKLAELAAATAVERDAAAAGPAVARPLHEGVSGQLWQASKVLTALSLLVSLLPLPRRTRQLLTGTLGTLAGLALRFGVFRAGFISARDPHATFAPQRAHH